ncbi:MAG: hypothetical protein PHF66_12170 [Desulfobacteraceae bacterium]|nr:hypothetical protein [Desulfobacteraceae bacterium]MDD3993311.1 hypothetical protein [Desulfobacteraceae bacterium]
MRNKIARQGAHRFDKWPKIISLIDRQDLMGDKTRQVLSQCLTDNGTSFVFLEKFGLPDARFSVQAKSS